MPTVEKAVNIGVTAAYMERVRSILEDNPIQVTSWYRSPLVNKAVKGSTTSDHLQGYAVDFKCPFFGDPYDVAAAIEYSDLMYDQLILEYGWVHISFAPRMRRESLTKKSASSPYVKGIVK